MSRLKSLFASGRTTFANKDELSSYFIQHFGIKPKKIELYKQALTHKSISAEFNNERLEYLGDTILSGIVSSYLYEKFPEKDEGGLTVLTSKIVTRDKLNEIGSFIQLNEHLVAVEFQRGYKNIVGNAFEAVVGAIFLDHGFDKTAKSVYRSLLRHIDLVELDNTKTNFKSVLIVWGQKTSNQVIFKGKRLPESNKYKSTLYINSKKISSAAKDSKKEAELYLAEKVLKSLFSEEG